MRPAYPASVGRFTQAGREWRPAGEPHEVSTYGFLSDADGKAIPSGVYDLADDSAWVSVGVDHDTSAFAVATIEKWWQQMGKDKYPHAHQLVITADGGGSNGHRPWLGNTNSPGWPPRSDWRSSSVTTRPVPANGTRSSTALLRITGNWRGCPLATYQTIVNLIANTTTRTGLTVRCELDPSLYPTKIKLAKSEQQAIPLQRHKFHGEWNYTIKPSGDE